MGLRLAKALQHWQIALNFKGGNLPGVLQPFSSLIAKEVIKEMLT
jgi:hypothetical protein